MESEVIQVVTNINWLSTLESIASILGSLGVFVLTAYAFWLYHFSKKIKITGFGFHFSAYYGQHYYCTISNRTMSVKCITKITVVFNNSQSIVVKKFDEPFLLEPFRVYSIKGNEFTAPFDKIEDDSRDKYFILNMEDQLVYIKSKGKIKKRQTPREVSVYTNSYDNVVLSRGIKYVLFYWHKDDKNFHRVFITKTGIMDKSILGYNAFPSDVILDKDKMNEYVKKIFNNDNIQFQFQEIEMKGLPKQY